MLGTHVEHSLIFVVAQFEVSLGPVEVFLEHGHIIILQGVVQGQVTVVVFDIGARSNLINDWVLLVDANDVLYRLTFEVLLAASLEEFVATTEPVEDVLVAVSRTFKQRVLTEVVNLQEGLVLVLSEDLEHLHVLALNCK